MTRGKENPVSRNAADIAAALILRSFEEHMDKFQRITKRARCRFEKRDWRGRQEDALERLNLYEADLRAAEKKLKRELGKRYGDEALWVRTKKAYATLLGSRRDAGLCETFFNSLVRKALMYSGLKRNVEFFWLDPPLRSGEGGEPLCRMYRFVGDAKPALKKLLLDFGFEAPFEDLDRDVEYISREVNLYLWHHLRAAGSCAVSVIAHPVLRNKAAYVVGRICVADACIPMLLPLYNRKTGIYVDTVLLTHDEAGTVFSFSFSYFHVEVERFDHMVNFLMTLLPGKPVAELYNSIGRPRHGKTELYRDLHRFVHLSKRRFEIAPGKEGAVMIAFTLQNYPFVFKVIKDRPCFLRSRVDTTKNITRDEVMRRYDFVCKRDRVGRMVDTQEFENVKFKLSRFNEALLEEFTAAATATVEIHGDNVIMRHFYVQRRVNPLPLFFQTVDDAETLRTVVHDFGYFLRDLAAAGIFPGDMFNTWNYGVTRGNRVVLFDYDDVMALEQARFRSKPRPRDELEEMMADEDRITADEDDFFVEEMATFSGIPPQLKGVFLAEHGYLFTLDFWLRMQRMHERGMIADIMPYSRSKGFDARYGR